MRSLRLCFEDCASSAHFAGVQADCRWTRCIPGSDDSCTVLQCRHLQCFPTTPACWPAFGGFLLRAQDLCFLLPRCPGVLQWFGVCSCLYFFFFFLACNSPAIPVSPTLYFFPLAAACHPSAVAEPPRSARLKIPTVNWGIERERCWREWAEWSMWDQQKPALLLSKMSGALEPQESTQAKERLWQLTSLCFPSACQRSGAEGLQH